MPFRPSRPPSIFNHWNRYLIVTPGTAHSRMTAPMLTEQEVAALELPDLVALAGKVVGFLSPNSVQ